MKALLAAGALATAATPATHAVEEHKVKQVRTSYHNLVDPLAYIRDNPRYILNHIESYDVKGFDVDTAHSDGWWNYLWPTHVDWPGIRDVIGQYDFNLEHNSGHGIHFWQSVANLHGGPRTGRYYKPHGTNKYWTGGVDAGIVAHLITFNFMDKDTGVDQSYSIYYNTGRSTSQGYADIVFAAIVPGEITRVIGGVPKTIPNVIRSYSHPGLPSLDENHVPYEVTYPAIFGHRISFEDLYHDGRLHMAGSATGHVINQYMLEGFDNEPGNDNEFGNYLSGFGYKANSDPTDTDIIKVTAVNGMEGKGVFNQLAYDVAVDIYETLNTGN